MSKMKNIITVLTLAFAALLLTQCKKGIVEQPNVTPCSETIEVSLNVAEDGSKTGISSTGIVTWNTNDKLYVVGASDGYLGYISAQNSGTTAYFTGTITKPTTDTQNIHFYYTGNKGFELENEYYYKYDISQQEGTLADIAANLHLMHGFVPNIDKNTTNFGTITMTSMMSILQLQFSLPSETISNGIILCTGAYSGVKFNVKTGSLEPDNSSTYRRYIKSIHLKNVTSNVLYYMVVIPGFETLEFSKGLMAKWIEYPKNGSQSGSQHGYLANMMYANKEIALAEVSYLPNIFTVDNGADNEQGTDDDRQVKFSKGNLWYGTKTGESTPAFHFEDNQWDCLFNWNDNHICHLFWVTYSNISASYAKNTPPNGASTDVLFTNETGTTPHPSFTVDGQTGIFRTLNGTTNNTGEMDCIKARKKTINGINVSLWGNGKIMNGSTVLNSGMFLFPDDWDGTKLSGFKYGVSGSSTYYPFDNNKVDVSNWNSLVEAGVVFIPLGGLRAVADTPQITYKDEGKYWLGNASNSSQACVFQTAGSNGFVVSSGVNRASARLIRLVTDVISGRYAYADDFEPDTW